MRHSRTLSAAAYALLTATVIAAQSSVTVLKIATGPSGGEANGTFRLDEERARFDPTADKQVVALFQWDGAPGSHRLAVQWRSPDGGLSTSSAIDYVARDRRFGVYWTLPLAPTLPGGMWSVEATVDGQPAGRFTFELTPAAMRSDVVVRRPLPAADMFARLNAVFVALDRQSAAGQHLEPGAAFISGSGRLSTSLAALDGADAIDVVLADGQRKRIDTMQSFNRRQDWAVIPGPTTTEGGMTVAAANATKVGDRCFSMEGTPAGGRVLVEGVISGQSNTPSAGERLIAQWSNGTGMPGAPVVNEFGELIGFVGGSLVPGTSTTADLLHFRSPLRGTPVVPQRLVRPVLDGAPTALAELRARGEILPALRGSEHVLSAGFAKRMLRTDFVAPSEIQEEFVPDDKTFIAFVSWSPQARLKGVLTLRLFQAETNQQVAESKPKKINLGPNNRALSSWTISVPQVPGWYRGEFLVDNVPLYRAFVHIGG